MAKNQNMTFTLLSADTKSKLSDFIKVGQEMTVKSEPVETDTTALKIYVDGMKDSLGFAADAKKLEDTESKVVLYELMKKHEKLDGVRVKVVRFEQKKIYSNHDVTTEACVFEVMPGEFTGGDEPLLEGEQAFELHVKGSHSDYPKKIAVLGELKDSGSVPVLIKYEDGEIVVYYEDGKAGLVDSASTGYDEAAKVLSKIKDNEMMGRAKVPLNSTYTVRMTVDEETLTYIKTGKRPLTLAELKKEKSSFIPMERLNRIQKYLEASGLSKKHIMKVMQGYREYPAEVAGRIPEPTVQFADSFGGVKKTVVYLNKGKHLRFIGEKGTGKNLLVTTLAWIYQRPLYELSMNAETDKYDLLGSKSIESDVIDGKEISRMSFDKEALVEALEVGGFINLDEVNMANPSVLVLMHSIVDDRGSIEVPSYGRVQADDNFGIILTMNPDYVGTTQLNEATRDRFTPIIFPNNESIAQLLKARVPSAKAEDIKVADRIYKDIMRLVDQKHLTMDCVTIRGFIDALEVVEDLGIKEAMEDGVANRIEDAEYRLTVSAIIDKVIA